MSRKSMAVNVEGQIFKSMNEAARFLNCKSTSVWFAAHTGNKYKGLDISLVEPVETKPISITKSYYKPKGKTMRKSTKKDNRNCPVHCETLNRTFKTITNAAKFAGVNKWTMGLKMETAGQFVDKKGNVYKRMKPMVTDKAYTNTGDTVKRVRTGKRKVAEKHNDGSNVQIEMKHHTSRLDVVIDLMTLAHSAISERQYDKVIELCNALKILDNE